MKQILALSFLDCSLQICFKKRLSGLKIHQIAAGADFVVDTEICE
jgi:hypothetical protein